MYGSAKIGPTGDLSLRVAKAPPALVGTLGAVLRAIGMGLPWPSLLFTNRYLFFWRLRNQPHLWRGVFGIAIAKLVRANQFYSALHLRMKRADGELVELGVVGFQVVTTVGVNKIVAVMNATDASTGVNFKYHATGKQVSPTAPAIGDTTLQSELSTEYATDNVRPTGSQTVGGSNNIYRSVGTNTVDAVVAATEYGIFSQAATGGGSLLDRFTYTTVNLASGDSLQGTFDLTFAAGG